MAQGAAAADHLPGVRAGAVKTKPPGGDGMPDGFASFGGLGRLGFPPTLKLLMRIVLTTRVER